MKTSRTVGQRKGGSQKIMKTTMATKPKVHFDPKVNFELPREIGPLLEQTVSVSIAESIDASFELSFATQNAAADFEKQFAIVQSDAKEVAEKIWSATTQNIDVAFGYALKLAQANTVRDCFETQVDFLRTQSQILMRQAQDLSRSLGKFALHS